MSSIDANPNDSSILKRRDKAAVARTWQLSAAALGDLLTAGLAKDASLEAAARFGYAVVEKLAGIVMP